MTMALGAVLIWAVWVAARVMWASGMWLVGFVEWHLHGKGCIYCRPWGRKSPFRIN